MKKLLLLVTILVTGCSQVKESKELPLNKLNIEIKKQLLISDNPPNDYHPLETVFIDSFPHLTKPKTGLVFIHTYKTENMFGTFSNQVYVKTSFDMEILYIGEEVPNE